ncbi:hypothetical protein LfDm3_0256 [Fructilactobacillus fructivorans]|uniref:Uncharacterized protein n=1 Tax=Fructilactobacillus fructivorans TaxID=1614 RepID=A0A0C1PNL2_9LACO|nr:hypothetical protein LfDm3_0256 [Fructilactobacillus fructivorans]
MIAAYFIFDQKERLVLFLEGTGLLASCVLFGWHGINELIRRIFKVF